MKGKTFAPGTRLGHVSVTTRAAEVPVALEDELEGALIDAAAGEPPGPMLGKRLERIAREILLRRGLGAARVLVSSGPRGTSVTVQLPPDGPRVREIVLSVGG